jgi:hypothetical protein
MGKKAAQPSLFSVKDALPSRGFGYDSLEQGGDVPAIKLDRFDEQQVEQVGVFAQSGGNK